ncbi:MAG: hypothetical protein IT324_01295 [Anaerolineae bacterium]|nr:hypothetical protein [Anaerolineae bacterium]
MQRQFTRLFVPFILLIAALPLSSIARAADPTPTLSTTPITLSVTGSLTSGTGGVKLPAGLVVTLHIARPGPGGRLPAEILKRDVPLAADNSYRFDNIIAAPGDIAFITTTFEGVTQGSPLIQLPNEQNTLNLSATLYAPTNDPAVLTLLKAQHILDFLPNKTVQVLATHTYKNTSDRLYLSKGKTAAGLPVSVVIPLPVGARAIAFNTQPPARFAVGGDPNTPVVQDTKPVLPGQAHEIVFSYQVPFEGSAPIDQDYPYSTAALEILIPDDSRAAINDAIFTTAANTTLNPKRPYTQYLLKAPLKAGDRVKYTLTQVAQPLPVAQPEAPSTANIGGIVIAVLVLILLAGIGLYVATRRTSPSRKKPR